MPRFKAPRFPLCLGGNVFGWTADEETSFAVLDAFVDGGGSMIDTADAYSAWVDGNEGGESESVIGNWLAKSGRRDEVVIVTKVSQHPKRKGLKADNIAAAVEDSLGRLQTDRIDLYLAHFDDGTPLAETLGAFRELEQQGKILDFGLSNYEPDRIREAVALAPEIAALQPKYSLAERTDFEGERQRIAQEHDLAVIPYYALASGFLTGKYRPGDAGDDASPRAGGARKYLESERGPRILEALDDVAGETDAPVAAVALAWLAAQPTIVAPIASARTTDQLADLMHRVDLDEGQLERLTQASQ